MSTIDEGVALRRIQQLETALIALLTNVEEFGFDHISIEHPMVHGVKLAREAVALPPRCSICRRRHCPETVHEVE